MIFFFRVPYFLLGVGGSTSPLVVDEVMGNPIKNGNKSETLLLDLHLKNAYLLSRNFQCFVIYCLFKWLGVDFSICCILLIYCVFHAEIHKTGILSMEQ